MTEMTEFISYVLALCDDKPITICIDNKPYVICTEEYFEKYKKSEDE